jgi:hypothetical protein
MKGMWENNKYGDPTVPTRDVLTYSANKCDCC